MRKTVMHVLSQRPVMTGSGITLDALVRQAAIAGWDQCAVVGTPADDPRPAVGGIPGDRVHPLLFGSDPLPFPVPGMSDVMPYPSTRFSDLTSGQLEIYRVAWRDHLRRVGAAERPDLIHVHHAWILASQLKDLFPDTPIVTHCHATGLRQMSLCSHLAGDVRRKLRRNEVFVVLHGGDASRLTAVLDLPADRVRIVGAGYRDDLFHQADRSPGENRAGQLLFVGKFSRAKGLPWLLDAVEQLRDAGRPVRLHVAGGGSGEESRGLEARMRAMEPLVTLHGSLSQADLAALMQGCAVCVLPSFYEGLPLVLVEAAACGCRLVATRLEGVVSELVPHLGSAMDLVSLPRLSGIDSPVEEDLPAFVERLRAAVEHSLEAAAGGSSPPVPEDDLAAFTWASTFARVEQVWNELL